MISGVLLFVPMNVTICMLAMVHTFILYWIGVLNVMKHLQQSDLTSIAGGG